jgi:hypothetical protein
MLAESMLRLQQLHRSAEMAKATYTRRIDALLREHDAAINDADIDPLFYEGQDAATIEDQLLRLDAAYSIVQGRADALREALALFGLPPLQQSAADKRKKAKERIKENAELFSPYYALLFDNMGDPDHVEWLLCAPRRVILDYCEEVANQQTKTQEIKR